MLSDNPVIRIIPGEGNCIFHADRTFQLIIFQDVLCSSSGEGLTFCEAVDALVAAIFLFDIDYPPRIQVVWRFLVEGMYQLPLERMCHKWHKEKKSELTYQRLLNCIL